MSQYIAFLRAINVGGHTVKMETLRELFEAQGFSEVETFIASGNVIFRAGAQKPAALEAKIAAGLQAALGFEVAAFLRTPAEVARSAAYAAFPAAERRAAPALNIAFLARPLDEAAQAKLQALTSAIDRFAAHEREIYWLCQKKQSESKFSNALLERKLGLQATWRGANTLARLAARLKK